MTRESAVRTLAAYYRGTPVASDTLLAAMRKLNFRHKTKLKLHPLPASTRHSVNMVLLFNLGKALRYCATCRTLDTSALSTYPVNSAA